MRVLAGLILALYIYGCGDPLRPTNAAGTYTLVTVAGEALPWTMFSNPDCRTTVAGGTLVIGADATFEMWRDEIMACPLSAEPTVSTAYSAEARAAPQ